MSIQTPSLTDSGISPNDFPDLSHTNHEASDSTPLDALLARLPVCADDYEPGEALTLSGAAAYVFVLGREVLA